jgi:CBS domain-containing protein
MNTLGNEMVSTIMTTQLYSVSPSNTLKEAKGLIAQHSIRHLTVIQNGQLVGILGKNDLDRFSFPNKGELVELQTKLSENLSVEHLMTKSVHTLQHDDTIKEAAEMLSLSSYHALPVLDGHNLVGIVTSTDLILYLLRHCNGDI